MRDGVDAPHEELGLHLVLAHDLVVGAHLCDKQIDDTRLVVAAVAAVELPLLGECGRDALALGGGRIPRPAQELRLARHGDGDRADIFELRGPHRNQQQRGAPQVEHSHSSRRRRQVQAKALKFPVRLNATESVCSL